MQLEIQNEKGEIKMKKNLTNELASVGFIVAFFVLFVLMGCAQTHFLSKESKWRVFNRVNEKHDKIGKIKTTNQNGFEGKNIRIASDFTTWINPKTKNRHAIVTSTIKEIEFSSNQSQYFLAGAGVGLLAGAFLGFVIGMLEDSKRITLDPFSSNPDPASGIKKNAIIGASIGMGVGIIIGIGITPKERFVLDYIRR